MNPGDEFDRETERAGDSGPTVLLSPIELRPEPFQERLLEQIAVARRQGHHRNLLVSATGTGKTVMAALDYVRLRAELPRARLLFVAPIPRSWRLRRRAARATLLVPRAPARRSWIRARPRSATPCASRRSASTGFGQARVGGHRPTQFELTAAGLDDLAPDHFDVVIVDEFHHAAARSYERLLDHVAPVELLGLTATPERADGLSLLGRFDGRIAAELRRAPASAAVAAETQLRCGFTYLAVRRCPTSSNLPSARSRRSSRLACSDSSWQSSAASRRVTDPWRST